MSEQENRNIAIELKGVKKQYRLGQIGGGTLTADLQSWWARVRGKEDPNIRIDQDQRLIGKTFMALNGIDLTIYQGEAIGIIGSNGAGKSTMLKLLSRVTAPTAGDIDIYGRVASMLEVGTGFHGEMTGRENVYLNGAILGMTKAEIDAKMEDIIEFSEVREFIDTPVKRYSSGMYVKLAFSVAAHLDSEIMIMDEVLAVGDINFQQKCLKKMRSAATEEGRTVLYVSHNMSTIRQLCNRCIVLDGGKIIYDGDVEEAINVYSKSVKTNDFIDNKIVLANIDRGRNYDTINELLMTELTVNSPTISMGEPFVFKMSFKTKKRKVDSVLRIVIFSKDGAVVGGTYSDLFTLYKRNNNEVGFSFCTGNLAPGTYLVDLILCSYENGVQEKHDYLSRAFSFSVLETKVHYNMQWKKAYWGNVIFDKVRVLNNGKTDSEG